MSTDNALADERRLIEELADRPGQGFLRPLYAELTAFRARAAQAPKRETLVRTIAWAWRRSLTTTRSDEDIAHAVLALYAAAQEPRRHLEPPPVDPCKRGGHWQDDGWWYCNACRVPYPPDSFHARMEINP